MAKLNKGLINISGTLGGITLVQTRTGPVARARRGTHKPATCNEKLQRENKRNNIVNTPAKRVNDVLLAYAKDFKKSNLWSDLLSKVRQCSSDVFIDLLRTMEGTEANPRYPFSKILPCASAEVNVHKGVITLAMHLRGAPVFAMTQKPVQYCIEWHVLFIDDERAALPEETINSGWMDIAQPLQKFETSFEIPVMAKYYVVFAKVQGGKGEQFMEDRRAMGVRVMKVGEVG